MHQDTFNYYSNNISEVIGVTCFYRYIVIYFVVYLYLFGYMFFFVITE